MARHHRRGPDATRGGLRGFDPTAAKVKNVMRRWLNVLGLIFGMGNRRSLHFNEAYGLHPGVYALYQLLRAVSGGP